MSAAAAAAARRLLKLAEVLHQESSALHHEQGTHDSIVPVSLSTVLVERMF